MTWKQFKEAVETAGVTDKDEIFCIDTGVYPNPERMHVAIDDDENPREINIS